MITQSFLSADFTKRDIHERSGLVCGNTCSKVLQVQCKLNKARCWQAAENSQLWIPSEDQPSRFAIRCGSRLLPRGAQIRTRKRHQLIRPFSWYSSVPPGKLRDRPLIKQRTLSFHFPINRQLNNNIRESYFFNAGLSAGELSASSIAKHQWCPSF